MATLYWLQTGACGGDSLAILEARSPSLEQLISSGQIDLLWHPSLSHQTVREHDRMYEKILQGEQTLDILCVEGSIIMAPRGTGLYDTYQKKARKDMVLELAQHAGIVVAMGTCSAFGGVHAAGPNPSDCIGLQFNKDTKGGLLPPEWVSHRGTPVINVAGCPAHPHTMTQTLAWLANQATMPLDTLNRPKAFFETMVHEGCNRNEYHEYDIEMKEPGGPACMFFNLGCQGPMTQAICNTDLWNGVSSKTRAGVPCFGCTSPQFPSEGNLFDTEKIGDVPKRLPTGVDRGRYMAYKNLARAAAPERIRILPMEADIDQKNR